MTTTLVSSVSPVVTRQLLAPTEARRVWEEVAAADPTLLPEQSPSWVDAICASGRFEDATRVYSSEDGAQFVLPLVRRRGLVGIGGRLSSFPPAWGMGGLVGVGQTPQTIAAVVDDLRSMSALSITIRIDPTDDVLWRDGVDRGVTVLKRRAHVAQLPSDADVHLRELSQLTRRSLRIADRNNVRVEVCDDGTLLETHYGLYLKSVARWAADQHEPLALAMWRARRRDPMSKLRTMSDHLGSRMITAIAYVDDQPAASTIVMLGPTARETRAAMDMELAGPTRAAYAVQWATIEAARRFGSTSYNMGESGQSEGIAFFKERFGAVAIDHAEYRIERLPLTAADRMLRQGVKRIIGFRDQ